MCLNLLSYVLENHLLKYNEKSEPYCYVNLFFIIIIIIIINPVIAVAQWWMCCATNRKVTGSILDGVMEFFIDINPSDRTMALRSTQPLTEMSTKSISWG
jgi:hypothetical protein